MSYTTHGPTAAAALALLLAATPAAALGGRVTHPDGTPVVGAEISILGRPGLTRTDADGRFVWTPDPAPPFEVLVVAPGGRVMHPILVTAIPETILSLQVSPVVEESITVTAGGALHIESTPAAGTTLLTGREIRVRAPTNLTQALENVAGVASASEGQAAVPAVRGLSAGRTLILIDGARVSAERRAGPSATYLDPVVLETIEVSRGPGSVAYGSDAIGGVIHARTRGARPDGGFGGRVVGDLGVGLPQQRAALELTHGTGDGGLLMQAHYRNFDDYGSPEGTVFNSGSRDYGGRLRYDHFTGRSLVTLSWQGDFGRDVERPRTNSQVTRFFYPEENSHRFVASWEAARLGGFNRLGANAFLGSYSIVTDQDRFATAQAPRSVERADVSARDFHVRGFGARAVGEARIELGIDVNGRFGVEALDIGLGYGASGAPERTDTTVSIEDARRVDAAVYASVEGAPAPRLSLAGGVRVDRVTTRNRGGYFGDLSTENGAVSGYASASLGPFGGLGLTAQVSRGFRDPVVSDRYFRGPTGRGFITGNPELDPEVSLQLDLALRYTGERWRVSAYAYHYRIDDLIERFEDEEDFFFFHNRGRARLHGVELEAQAELGAGLDVELAGHVIRGRALDDGTPLDDVPPPTLTARLTREFSRGFVQLRGAHYAEDDRPGPTEQPREAYELVDLAASFRLTEGVEVRALLRNLLDEAYLVSADRRAVLAPGRSAVFTASVAF